MKHLSLNLSRNNLKGDANNFKWLLEGMTNLPNNMNEIILELYCNKLEKKDIHKLKDDC